MAKVLDCGLKVSFEFQLHNHIYFQTNAFEKAMNLPAMG